MPMKNDKTTIKDWKLYKTKSGQHVVATSKKQAAEYLDIPSGELTRVIGAGANKRIREAFADFKTNEQ